MTIAVSGLFLVKASSEVARKDSDGNITKDSLYVVKISPTACANQGSENRVREWLPTQFLWSRALVMLPTTTTQGR